MLGGGGPIAAQEGALIMHATLLMLIVVMPVFFLLFFFAWRYREGNLRAKYIPNWEHSKIDELIWWAIPFEIVLVLGALTWQSTYALDPHQPLRSDVPPLTIEVVALPWKWLFIYPKEGIATLSAIEIPTNTPINFEITADAPMNSFFIPQLGGQIYAMTGMVNPLHLMANKAGVYQGISANYSGEGFAQMHFSVAAVSQEEFDAWVAKVKTASSTLSIERYEALAKPSIDAGVMEWSSVEPELFQHIVDKFSP